MVVNAILGGLLGFLLSYYEDRLKNMRYGLLLVYFISAFFGIFIAHHK